VRPRRFLLTAGIGVAVAAVGLAAVLWLGDGSVPSAASLRRHGYFGAFLLLYLEESGLPLLVPGDAFVVYVGHRLPDTVLPWLGAWLGIIGAVTLGATNLYFLSRALGRRLIEHPIARFVHLSHARLDAAEHRFRRWGPWAVLIGRHVPGMRVPITVACGVLRIPYRVFAPCVAVSTAVWAGIFMGLGATFGEEARQLLAVPFAQVLSVSVLAGALGSFVLLKLPAAPATRRPLAFVAFASAQGALLAIDFMAGATVALGVLAVVALLPAGWLLGGRAAALVLIVFVAARLADYGLGGNVALMAAIEILAGAAVAVAAHAAAASAWKARREMAREASHDLRTPLTVLQGYISMLEDGTLPSERARNLMPLLAGKTRELNEGIDAVLARVRDQA
jgi:membrane protein DedA with SNARE-associated domain